MENKLRIAIIGIYYGTFPDWMPYWLKSCQSNSTIDFLLVTDIKNIEVPNNVHVMNMSLKELKKLAEEKLKMQISLEKPYKICDYKPVYGVILEEYLKEYDYWGHCDFDLIWGDIRSFIEKYEIEKYDKFLPLGHLALYKNTEKCNNYYKLSGSKCGDYKNVFQNDNNFAFDETDGIYSIYKKNNLKMFTDRIFAEIKTFHKRFRLKKCDKNYKHQVFYFEDGKIYRAYEKKGKIKTQEYIYIHFRRKLPVDELINFKDIDNFYITYDGFVEKTKGIPTIKEIEKYNHNPGNIIEGIETIKFCIKNLKKIPQKVLDLIKEKIEK